MDRLRRAQSCPWQFAAFHRAHMELTAPDLPITLDDPDWPFLTSDVSVGPARVPATARVAESLPGPGVDLAGTVEGSVLGRHVTVEEGAVVRRSVVLDGAVVRGGPRSSTPSSTSG